MRTAVLLSLLLHLAAAFHQLHYLVVLPATLHSSSTQVACLHITCYGAKLQLSLALERSAGAELLLQETIQKEKAFICTKFWVAPPADGPEEIATAKLIITGKGVSVEEEKKVLIRKVATATFIQTDQPSYQPGQTVRFRVVTLDEELNAVNDSVSLFLQDPKENRIEQWLDVVPQDGIADLSFQLSEEPLLGTYAISMPRARALGTFSVQEHVLPKFVVIFESPTQIYALDQTFPLQICGRYPSGRGVQGVLHVSLCQKIAPFLPSASKPDLCQEFSNQTDGAGCFFTEVSLSSFSRDFRYYQDSILAEALLLEDGTEIRANASHKVLISRIVGMALFAGGNPYYHPGEMYRGKIKVMDYQGKPLKHKKVLVVVSSGEHHFKQKFITGASGTASFSLDTTAWNRSSASLEASVLQQDSDREPGAADLSYQRASRVLLPFYSSSRSLLSISPGPEAVLCGTRQAVQVEFSIAPEELAHGPKRLVFSYLVTGKRGIVHVGQKTIWVGLPRMLRGFFSIPLTFTSTYAPVARLVVYVIFPNGQIIADAASFSVSSCFRNKVELSFSRPEALPESKVGLHLQAAPGSTCAVWAVNWGSWKPGKELSSSWLSGLFPSSYSSGYPHQVSEDDHSCGFPAPDEPDVFTAFREMGLKILSNTSIRRPRLCPTPALASMLQEAETLTSRPMQMFAQLHRADSTEHLTTSPYQPTLFPPASSAQEKAQKHLPRTWIWDLYSMGPSGSKNVTVTVPDTITEWKAGMFCTGPSGFGLAPASSLLVFKPFLVELPVPPSVIQGESFTLEATVTSSLQRCMRITVSLEELAHLQLKPCQECVYSSCLCAGEAKTFQWTITAEQLGLMNITLSTEAVASQELCGGERPFVPSQGQKDTISKVLLVRAEGVLVEKAHSSILCPKQGNPAQESVSLLLPPDVVEGSVRATVSVTGDLMGPALQNLGQLVQMPHGCGEQNMVLFAPTVYLLQYLEKTRQLSPEIKERARGLLRSGYQIQLQYQHPDGSYSEFGTEDEYGNTWLTAFVVKCFVQAKPFIFVDEQTIQAALSWLQFHQLPSGCFRNVGQLFHTAMKGGVDGEVPLAAYITAAYLEAGETPEAPVVSKALGCLAPSLPNAASTYTQALLAYTFALAKDSQRVQELLHLLDGKAIRAEGQIHWSQALSDAGASSSSPWSQPLSVDVEMTAYVLLALLSKPNVTEPDLHTASGIVAWLTRQQNAYGGFASTQDTVVALQALAKYAALTYSTEGAAEVRVTSQGGFGRHFQVSYQNRLLVQEVTLAGVPGEFSLQANGSCCVFARLVLRYNTASPQLSTAFALRVRTEPSNCSRAGRQALTLYVHVRYTGKRSSPNMVIVEVSLLSGFVLAPESGMSLQHWHSVRRAEKTEGGVAIYLDKLSHESETYVLHLQQKVGVTNLKPGHVRVYDYYHPEEQALADYNVLCI